MINLLLRKIKGPKLTFPQWKLLASAFSNIAQAVILFSLAAFFVPEAVSLSSSFSQNLAVGFLFGGLLLLAIAVIISKKER